MPAVANMALNSFIYSLPWSTVTVTDWDIAHRCIANPACLQKLSNPCTIAVARLLKVT